ncbi:MAG TPA: hypothetical protein VEL31_19205 [Ktedonobacteraceae bacterium]|nr:hypothetical protein [Ktedonobacteraceae bacterium]
MIRTVRTPPTTFVLLPVGAFYDGTPQTRLRCQCALRMSVPEPEQIVKENAQR